MSPSKKGDETSKRLYIASNVSETKRVHSQKASPSCGIKLLLVLVLLLLLLLLLLVLVLLLLVLLMLLLVLVLVLSGDDRSGSCCAKFASSVALGSAGATKGGSCCSFCCCCCPAAPAKERQMRAREAETIIARFIVSQVYVHLK